MSKLHGRGIPVSFDKLFEFEQALADYTGSPYAVVTDCCTHAIEICMILDNVNTTKFSAYTYLSIPQLMHKLSINFKMTDEQWIGEYQFANTNIWDSARRLQRGMYRKGQKQCLSFGFGKPMQLGRCGAILLDDTEQYRYLSRLRADGRDLRLCPWQDHDAIVGYHYCPTIETCEKGLKILPTVDCEPVSVSYPDCRQVQIIRNE